MNKPKIVWLCDVEGWAYANRARLIAKTLRACEHYILFFEQITKTDKSLLDQADIIVAGSPRVLPWLGMRHGLDRVVTGLTGFRPFESPSAHANV